MKSLRLLVLMLLLVIAGVSGSCRRSSELRYDLKGKVVLVEREKHLVTIAHEEIEGLMPAMTMPFTVPNKSDLEFLAPDDQVTATLVIDGSDSWLENLIITRQSANPGVTPVAVEAKAGAEVPNYVLKNQDGKEIRIHNYRGKTLLLTFIYTRCPLPEYCALMSNNFAKIDRSLREDAELYAGTHLLSVSIDPEFDTPQVLRSYGAAYTEQYEKETFSHWEFASGTPEQVKAMAQFFGLQYFPEKDEIIHGLRTVIIDPEGKVAKTYNGNEWKPDEVVNDLRTIHRLPR